MRLSDRISLIENWRDAWRFASMWINAVTMGGVAWWIQAADEDKLNMLRLVHLENPAWLVVIAITANALARVVRQPKLTGGAQ